MATLSTNTQLIEERIDKLCRTLEDHFYNHYHARNIGYEVNRGSKYYKIIMVENYQTSNESRSVHAFVAKQTGTIYKPASWKAPAAHARYQLLDDQSFETCLHNADWAGQYLYMR
jgi:hypothetical protein